MFFSLPLWFGIAWFAAWQAPADSAPWDLLSIAERETLRATNRLRDELGKQLESIAYLDPESRSVRETLEDLAQEGAPLVPLLFEKLDAIEGGLKERRAAKHSAQILMRVFEKNQDLNILRQLQQRLAVDNLVLRTTILQGLQGVSHKLIVEMVRPFLGGPERPLSQLSIRILRHQTSQSAVAALRPLLESGQDADMVIGALLALGDEQSSAGVAVILANTKSPAEQRAAIDYLQLHGSCEAVDALREMLLGKRAYSAFGTLETDAATALWHIGVTQPECADSVEQHLVALWNKAPLPGVRDHARFLLGPFENEAAYESFRKDYQRDTKDRRQRSNPLIHLGFARIQLQFHKFSEALTTLKRVQQFDEGKDLGLRIAELQGLAYCGLQQWDRAEKALEKSGAMYDPELPHKYPFLTRVWEESRCKDWFHNPDSAKARN